MTNYVTDTHSLIWYLEDSPRLGTQARAAFEACDRGEALVYVPTISLVEIVYLQEKGRIPAELKTRLEAELQNGNTGLILADLTLEVANQVANVSRDEIPDMPDRIISATALQYNLTLISRDKRIRLSNVATIW